MSKFLITIILILPLQALGQNDTISFVAYWSKGDVFKYQVKKTTKIWRDGKLSQRKEGNYKARLEVLDSTATYYRVQWTYEINPKKFFNLPDNVQNLALKLSKMKVIYKTSELGEFQELENWQEVYQTLLGMSEVILQSYKDKLSDTEKKAMKERLNAFLKLYNSSEGIASLFLKELQVLHFAFGAAFKVGDTVTYEDQLPNMMGGKPLKADAKLFIDKVDTVTQQCVLRHQMHINPAAAKAFMLQVIQKMGASKETVQQEIGQAKFDINDDNYLEYNYVFGVPIKIRTHRVAHIQFKDSKNRREDKVNIQLIRD
ncbi:hypothetical protein BKI52_25640 [marine bacterium AO1-C]|nr:hypothetical protein BKI52_25640 [marine bacterium AO1-C]